MIIHRKELYPVGPTHERCCGGSNTIPTVPIVHPVLIFTFFHGFLSRRHHFSHIHRDFTIGVLDDAVALFLNDRGVHSGVGAVTTTASTTRGSACRGASGIGIVLVRTAGPLRHLPPSCSCIGWITILVFVHVMFQNSSQIVQAQLVGS